MAKAGTVSVEEAEKQARELRPRVEEREAPKGAAPGTHPLRPVESDPEALRRYRGQSAEPTQAEDGLWHLTAYDAPVFVPGDRMPAAASSRRGGEE